VPALARLRLLATHKERLALPTVTGRLSAGPLCRRSLGARSDALLADGARRALAALRALSSGRAPPLELTVMRAELAAAPVIARALAVTSIRAASGFHRLLEERPYGRPVSRTGPVIVRARADLDQLLARFPPAASPVRATPCSARI